MSEFVAVAKVDDCPPGNVVEVDYLGQPVALANIDGHFYAVENECSHMITPLCDGDLDQEACTLECPLHGSVFDLRTGVPQQPPADEPIETFDVTVEDDVVLVRARHAS